MIIIPPTIANPDGSYTSELVLSPLIPPVLRDRMNKERANNAGGKSFIGGLQGESQSGSFYISDGSVVSNVISEKLMFLNI